MTKAEKLSHLTDLIHLSLIDNRQIKIERVYIEKVSSSLGVEDRDLQKLYNEVTSNTPLTYELPDRESKIIPLFHRLLIMMTIDRTISESEILLCKEIGLRMGLNLYVIDKILDLAVSDTNDVIDPRFINSIFKKYYN